MLQANVYMDHHGYVSVDELIELRAKSFSKPTNLYEIRLVVENCPKQRFELWEDHRCGHGSPISLFRNGVFLKVPNLRNTAIARLLSKTP